MGDYEAVGGPSAGSRSCETIHQCRGFGKEEALTNHQVVVATGMAYGKKSHHGKTKSTTNYQGSKGAKKSPFLSLHKGK